MLDNKLIESALALTGKTMEDMEELEIINCMTYEVGDKFSYPKFFYYLLSPGFLEEYMYYVVDTEATPTALVLSESFGRAIYKYQSGNSAPIVELLTQI